MAEKLPYDYTRMALDDAQKKIAAQEAQLKEARETIKGLLGEDRDLHYSQEWYAKVETFLKETE